MRLELDANALAEADPLPLLTHFVQEHQGLRAHRERIFVILADLYHNALEHGLLGLESSRKDPMDGFGAYFDERERRLAGLDCGRITLEISNVPHADGGRVTFKVTDSGPGYDVSAPRAKDSGAAPHTHRRGLTVVTGLCERVAHNEIGNEVQATYCWS